tara:strand:- start:149244 stop:149645 length:402 start_codon:yes stop_codon:yes gene_type:complete
MTAQTIYHEWDRALANNDKPALLALYDENATIESPLIPHLLKQPTGICQGKTAIAELINEVSKHKPKLRRYHRTPCLQHDNLIMWEYPRQTPEGEQMDFVEVMELNDKGLIQKHRVYWGWRGFQVLMEDEYHA